MTAALLDGNRKGLKGSTVEDDAAEDTTILQSDAAKSGHGRPASLCWYSKLSHANNRQSKSV